MGPVTEYLRENQHHQLTPEKVRERATVVEGSARTDRIVFDVERHRGALGAQYTEGAAMPAFETYWQRYAYDPEAEKLEMIGENVSDDRRPTLTIENYTTLVNHRLRHAVDFVVEPVEEGRYQAEELVMGTSRVVRSKEELLAFARDCQATSWKDSVDSMRDQMSKFDYEEDRMQEILSRVREAEIEVYEREASSAWEG